MPFLHQIKVQFSIGQCYFTSLFHFEMILFNARQQNVDCKTVELLLYCNQKENLRQNGYFQVSLTRIQPGLTARLKSMCPWNWLFVVSFDANYISISLQIEEFCRQIAVFLLLGDRDDADEYQTLLLFKVQKRDNDEKYKCDRASCVSLFQMLQI